MYTPLSYFQYTQANTANFSRFQTLKPFTSNGFLDTPTDKVTEEADKIARAILHLHPKAHKTIILTMHSGSKAVFQTEMDLNKWNNNKTG